MIPKRLNRFLILFPLMWSIQGRLTGPSDDTGPAPSQVFQCNLKKKWMRQFVEVRTESVEFTWLSEHIRGISVQRVKYVDGKWHPLEETPAKSTVDVEMVSDNHAKLRGLTPVISGRLQRGRGYFAVVLAYLEGNELRKQDEIIIKGDGRGVWTIQEAK